MKVFLSWSGNRSKAVAELLDEWLQCVLQAVNPWMSSKDIDRGSLWFNEISDTLGDTRIGIICLTQENKTRPWILFEAGALAKGLSSNRVCTLLIDLQPSDVTNPLAQFNHTTPTREGIYQLLATINKLLGDSSLNPRVLEKVFHTYWPQFENGFKKAIADHPVGESEASEPNDHEILKDILGSVRSVERRVRQLESDTPRLMLEKSSNALIESKRYRMAIEIIELLHSEGLQRRDIQRRLIDQGYPFEIAELAVHRFFQGLHYEGPPGP